jgi:hypothetical protein
VAPRWIVVMSVSLVWVSDWEGMDDPSETTEARGKPMRCNARQMQNGLVAGCHETGALLAAPRTLAVCEP